MKKVIDVETWKRKAHFQFFKNFEEPFYGMCVNVDVTHAYQYCKSAGHSFFLYHLYQSIRAVNQTPALRLRIEEDGSVVQYDIVHPSTTIIRPDDTFNFAYFTYEASFEEFSEKAQKVIVQVQASSGLDFSKEAPNTIHYSSIPWIPFTSLSHARHFEHKGSIPKITFGKIFEQGPQLLMPTSIHVHHALVDGIDIGRHLDWFQDYLNEQ